MIKIGDKVIDTNWLEEVYEVKAINEDIGTAQLADKDGSIKYTSISYLRKWDDIQKIESKVPEIHFLGSIQYYYCEDDKIYVCSSLDKPTLFAHGNTLDEGIRSLELLLESIEEETLAHEEVWDGIGGIIVSDEDTPQKFDNNKHRTDLIRPEFTLALGEVLAYGAEKYSEPVGETPNYLKGDGFNYSRIIGSLERHIQQFKMGNPIDDESGKHHLAHATANLMFLLTYELTGKGINDIVVLTKDGNEAEETASERSERRTIRKS